MAVSVMEMTTLNVCGHREAANMRSQLWMVALETRL
jgi:hypothetical protein